LRKSREELRRLAMTDALTGLFNRCHFNRVAEEEIGRALRYHRPLSVMMFDIDFFKRVNDTFGHNSGDRVLAMVARITREMLRTSEIAARYGGEEFIVLLPETPASKAAAVAERLRSRIRGVRAPHGTGVDQGNRQLWCQRHPGMQRYSERRPTAVRFCLQRRSGHVCLEGCRQEPGYGLWR
jgi:diguanylate cyclase (GGDEF)-like protein